jgi:hypothetical protein
MPPYHVRYLVLVCLQTETYWIPYRGPQFAYHTNIIWYEDPHDAVDCMQHACPPPSPSPTFVLPLKMEFRSKYIFVPFNLYIPV